jgi:nitrile hydratase subunit alpha
MNTGETAVNLAAQAQAVEGLLIHKGLIAPYDTDSLIETADDDLAPENGARVVARAWVDSAFRERLLADATAAARELGIQGPEGHQMIAVENTDALHNVIVCTQCSCTAWPLIGLPPDWYKRPPYRARVVREARTVLREMGLDLPSSVHVRVWDTSGDSRYVVLPQRPSGTDHLSEAELAALVSREALIGVSLASAPQA